MTRIGFAELGRVMTATEKVAPVPYDALRILRELATRYPEHEFVVFSRTNGDRGDLPPNVDWPNFNGFSYDDALTEAYFQLRDCDQAVVFVNHHPPTSLVGIVPKLRDTGYITPLQFGRRSAAPVIFALNWWQDNNPRREPVYIVNDPRSPITARDLKWPPTQPVIANFDTAKITKFYRFGDPQPPNGRDVIVENGHWHSATRYRYAAFELQVLPNLETLTPSYEHRGRRDFGFMSNENDARYGHRRRDIVRDWIIPNWPLCELRGQWTTESETALDRVFLPLLPTQVHGAFQRWASTLIVPTGGSGWATTHPWAAFAAGTAAFFHPEFDTQDHVLCDAPEWLSSYLRVQTREELWKKVEELRTEPVLWKMVVMSQREHLERRFIKTRGGFRYLEERLGLITEKEHARG